MKAAAFDPTTTRAYDVSYLHYASSMAILFGDESGMLPGYAGKTYGGKFVHGGGAINGVTEFGCVDCHNVHDTNGNDVAGDMMMTHADCASCHQAGAFGDATVLMQRTVDYGAALRDTVIDVWNTRNQDTNDPLFGQVDLDATLFHDKMAGRNAASEMYHNDLAVATAIYRVFNYDDGSPHGTEHGHGGSWAHNSVVARQMQYDAIEDLGDPLNLLGGLTRP